MRRFNLPQGANAESIEAKVQDGVLTFVTIVDKLMFRLDLDEKTYTKKSVPFTQEPDNIRILDDTLYLCTDGDHDPEDGVWGWNANGAFKVFYEVRWLMCTRTVYSVP